MTYTFRGSEPTCLLIGIYFMSVYKFFALRTYFFHSVTEKFIQSPTEIYCSFAMFTRIINRKKFTISHVLTEEFN